LKKNLERIRKN